MSGFICEPVTARHDRQRFDCGVEVLNRYLQTQARQDMKRKVAAVFAMVPHDEPRRVAGYYTLSAASVELGALPETVARKLPRYPILPAMLIGRLARDLGFPGMGKLLLMNALERALALSDEVAATFVIVDAKNATASAFYQRFGFVELSKNPRQLFLPMKTVADLNI